MINCLHYSTIVDKYSEFQPKNMYTPLASSAVTSRRLNL